MKKSTRNLIAFVIFVVGCIANSYDAFFYDGRSWTHSAFLAIIFLIGACGEFFEYREQKEIELKKEDN